MIFSQPLVVRDEPPTALADWARIPIAFEVRERLVLRAHDAGLGGLPLVAEPVDPPWVKDYDADPAHHPSAWAARFDVSRWGILGLYHDEERVGGAVVVASPDPAPPERRTNVALLWDLRVAPAARGRRLGGILFRAAERWARARGAHWLMVETQNVNVPACRFYARQRCELGAVHRHAYPTRPDEIQLLWYRSLAARTVAPDAPEASLAEYLTEIARHPALDAATERELATRARAHDQEALDRLVRANLRHVVAIARQYEGQGLSPSDIVNEGNLGLIRAAHRFSPTQPERFATMAEPWIRRAIERGIESAREEALAPAEPPGPPPVMD